MKRRAAPDLRTLSACTCQADSQSERRNAKLDLKIVIAEGICVSEMREENSDDRCVSGAPDAGVETEVSFILSFKA